MTSKIADCYHDDVLELFRHKCVRCGRHTEIVHEIVPKSRLPKTWMMIDNRVPLCEECHFLAHKRGAASSAQELRELRTKRLLEYVR